METTAQEKIFHQDSKVTISHSRFISNGKTYSMSNIASVSNHKIEKSRKWPIILIVVGILMTIPEGPRVMGVFLAVVGVVWLFLIKDEYSVRIQSNSGEADGLISKDKEYIQKVVNSVNDAMVHRG